MSVVVRLAAAKDLDAMLEIQQQGAFAGLANIFPQDQYPFPRSTIRQRWVAELDDPATYVYVCVEGEIVGFAATRGNELLHFGTAVGTWGSGIGEQFHDVLLGELTRTAPAACRSFRLSVFEANTRARRFYERLGWRATERHTRSTFAPYAVLVEYRRPRSAAIRRS